MYKLITAMAMTVLAFGFGGKAQAQELQARPTVKVGFYIGNDFLIGAGKHHLEGFEIGGDVPLIKDLKGIGGISFSPTVVFGGSNRKGADTDGMIYRFMVNIKRQVNKQGVYIGAGLGYSATQARSNQFANAQGFTSQLIVGYDLRPTGERAIQPFLEISLNNSVSNKLAGLSVDCGARF